MKAIVYEGFGSSDILRCQELEKPAPQGGMSQAAISIFPRVTTGTTGFPNAQKKD